MRILNGYLKNRHLHLPPINLHQKLRPTSERMRISLFSKIKVYQLSILDLFAGSGILGFESISQGASFVTGVESHPQIASYILHNINQLGIAHKYSLLKTNALSFNFNQKFNIIFIDPPYLLSLTDSFWNNIHNITLPNSTIILRRNIGKEYKLPSFINIQWITKYSSSTISCIKIN